MRNRKSEFNPLSSPKFNPSYSPLVREKKKFKNTTLPASLVREEKMRKNKFLNIPFIPYDKKLVSRARELRKETTEAEKIFWNRILKNKKFDNFKFTQQKPLDNFIVDFYCAELRLAIEIDGEIHNFQKARDKERDVLLEHKFGLKIIRYTNEEVLTDTERVAENLIKVIENTTHP